MSGETSLRKIALFDIDGTIYSGSEKGFSKDLASKLNAMRRKGILPAIATNRTEDGVQSIKGLMNLFLCCFEVAINDDYHKDENGIWKRSIVTDKFETKMKTVLPFILNNGGTIAIYDGENFDYVWHYPIKEDELESFFLFVKKHVHEIDMIEYSSYIAEEYDYIWLPFGDEKRQQEVSNIYNNKVQVCSLTDKNFKKFKEMIRLNQPSKIDISLKNKLDESVERLTHYGFKNTWKFGNTNIMSNHPIQINKGYAAEKLCEIFNLEIEMAAGNELLDIPLIEYTAKQNKKAIFVGDPNHNLTRPDGCKRKLTPEAIVVDSPDEIPNAID